MDKLAKFSQFDLELLPTTLIYNPRLAKVKVDPHAKNQGQRSNGSIRRAPTDKRTDTHTRTHTDATKRIISPATRSIKNLEIDNQYRFKQDVKLTFEMDHLSALQGGN